MLVEPRPGPGRHAGAAPPIGMACGQAPVQLDVLMERIRAELRARQHRTGADRRLPNGTGSRDARVRPVVLTWLALPEREFIHAAYIAVLGRQPDPDGQASIMCRLRSGEVDRMGVLVELQHSDEGLKAHRHVPGLKWRTIVYRCRRLRMIDTARSVLRLVRNLPRLAVYMRQVVARVDAAERCAAEAARLAIKAEAAATEAKAAVARLLAERADIPVLQTGRATAATPGDTGSSPVLADPMTVPVQPAVNQAAPAPVAVVQFARFG